MDENVESSKPNLKDRVTEKYNKMKEKVILNTIKNHVEKHKVVYYMGGLVVVAGITRICTRGIYSPTWTYSPKSIEMMNNINQIGIFSKQEIHANLTKIFKNDTGRPGYLVWNEETNRFFPSQTETGKVFGISNSTMSRHLNGHIPHAKGLHFERRTGLN